MGQHTTRKTPLIPFLKWAGGKRWLVPEITEQLSGLIAGKTYFEPFLGSGAIYFALLPERAILSDLNSSLIEAYIAVRDFPLELEQRLRVHHKRHCKEYYYKVRALQYPKVVERAAQFIYLNRTCWNGLYRVNKRNQFNVPIGTKSSVLFDSDDFKSISSHLANAEIKALDFQEVIQGARNGDIVFADPPYSVAHNNNGFLKYNEKIFSWNDQIRLHDSLSDAKSRGVKVLITNANTPEVLSLYKDFPNIQTLTRYSVISASSEHRKKQAELLIRSW